MAYTGVSSFEDVNCTERCRSVQHGREICAIATQGSDVQVLSLWKRTCTKFYKTRDEFGRSAIHIAASVGRPKVVEWLVKREGCDHNLKDLVSGYTPLHRSIYFGHLDVARALIRLDASLTIGDNEGFYPLDLCHLNNTRAVITDEELLRDPNEVYVWGSNENYNLGTGSEQPRLCPELLDKSKKLPWGNLGNWFIQVAMERYHTVFLHWSREVFCCGFGVGGRLGLGTEFAAFVPTKIDLGKDVECAKVAVGPDHTLFLLSNGTVKSCGLNENFVLGHAHVVNKVLRPKQVDLTAEIKDIAASRLHSVFLADDEVYVCGINVGQMGRMDAADKVIRPAKVSFPFDIDPKAARTGQKGAFSLVACNETATAVAHSSGSILVLKNYDCITINARHVNVLKIQLVGGVCGWSKEKGASGDSETLSSPKLTLFALNKTGRLLIWREGSDQAQQQQQNKGQGKSISAPHFNLAIFNMGRALTIRDFCANLNSIILTSNMGEAFKASFNPSVNPVCFPNINCSSSKPSKAVNQWSYVSQHSARHSTGKDPFSNMMLEHLKLRRIPNIYNAIKAFCDPKGNNFAITRRYQKADQFTIPQILPSEVNSDFSTLLQECSSDDLIHDVVFQVKNSRYPAHLFVIASRSKNFYDQIRKELKVRGDDIPHVALKGWEPRVFEQILQFLYTNNCDILISGNFKISAGDPDWLELVKLHARKLGLGELQKRLKDVYLEDEYYCCKRPHGSKDIKFSMADYPELLDVDLVSDDNAKVKVHLCVLVARLEYFKSMLLSQFWMEGNRKIKELKFPGTKVVMDIFLQMMYEGKIRFSNSGSKKDLEVLSQALIASDLLLSQQYRSQIESLLVDSINMDTVSEIVQLADFCNAPQIKEACMEFISLNVAPLLENRCLESIPDEMMAEISQYYRREFTQIESRRIKDSAAPGKDVYEEAEERLGDLFVELENICDSDYVTPKKGQASKAKVKLQARNRNASTCSNQDFDFPDPNAPMCLDDEDLEDLSDFESPSPKPKEKFIKVTKQKHSPRATTPAKEITIPVANRTAAVIIPSRKKLPLILDENYTALPRREPAQTVEQHPIIAPPKLQMSDFPSVEDSCKSPPTKEAIKAEIVSKDKDKKLSTEQSRTPQGSSRKKTKWKSLDETATPVTPVVPISESPLGRDPKNPWHRNSTTLNSNDERATNGNLSLDAIVRQEERKKENLRKALDKPLHLSQIEDQAVNQLLKRYTTDDVINGFELLTVERVSSGDEYAIPVWRKVGENPIE